MDKESSMKVIKEFLMNGHIMEGHIEFGAFLQNGTGNYSFSGNGAVYGYLYNCIGIHNSPRAIEKIKRK